MSGATRGRQLTIAAITTTVLALPFASSSGAQPSNPTPSDQTSATSDTKLLLILDGSRSMRGKDASGGTRIEAAKRALTTMVEELPDSAVVGLRVYGATATSQDPKATQCTDSQLTVPIGPIDRAEMTSSIDSFTGQAATPIGYALEQGAKDLGTDGKRNIVLVSDGLSNCDPPPCPTVQRLVENGVNIQVDTVGYGLDPTKSGDDDARDELKCIAKETNGTYYDAQDSDALNSSLVRISQRALRAYDFTGTRVKGASAYDQGPRLKPGQYLDTFGTDEGPRYYRIPRTAGSIVHFSVTSAARDGDDDGETFESYDITLQTPGGDRCDSVSAGAAQLNYSSRIAIGADAVTSLNLDPAQSASSSSSWADKESSSSSSWSSSSSSASSSASAAGSPAPTATPLTPLPSPTDTDPCRTASELVAQVTREEGETDEADVELLVTEGLAATNADQIPEPVNEDAPPLVAATSPEKPVVGGSSFSTAVELKPGTWTDELLPGEQLFYKIKADYGQQPILTVDVPQPGRRLSADVPTNVDLKAWSPTRKWLQMFGSQDVRANIGQDEREVLHRYAPRVNYRNHYAYATSGAMSGDTVRDSGQSGYYYFSLTAGTSLDDEGLQGPVPVRLRAAVDGQPSGAPEFADEAGADDQTKADAADGDGGGLPGWLPVLGGGTLALLGAAGVLVALLRGRRQAG